MSHELRTPLTVILLYAELLKKKQGMADSIRAYGDTIHRSGKHLLTLIENVLDLAKIEAGRTTLHPTEFDLFALLDNLENMFLLNAQSRGLRLMFEYEQGLPKRVRADAAKLRQVLINLLGNAVKFTQEGSITLRVSASEKTKLHFEVEDTGPGMAQDELETVFEPFVQSTAGQQAQVGAGLGLAISHKFIQLMGGEISVQSQPGKGTTFAFHIPVETVMVVAPQEQEDMSLEVVGLEPGQPSYRLLVVDDMPDTRLLIMELLKPLGFEVREAENGQEAITLFEEWKPDLIWMDIRMPVMDGLEATRRIKATQAGSTTPIIAVTASVFDEDRAQILESGCDDFLRKPFSSMDIYKKLIEHLGVRFSYRP
jgi:CheY-like chemotaxis protein/anti-sigma regulatory factor (Ser/Thr protein kinase)